VSREAFERILIKEISNFKCYFTGQENFLMALGLGLVVSYNDWQMLMSIFILVFMNCIYFVKFKVF
jgi:hypothetical protein